ncbi:rCG35060 [Rattus norvegicus]|uniref:RCG35060 n=1 Tax=Rattus norvegicus TaxID=10116 RepID=A6HKN6_RAT|nr:rCG35060 [Rattus norvegicus]
MGNQSTKQTHLHSWKWRMKIRLMCSSSRQEASTEKGTCYFTPEFCYRPRIHSQLESRNLVPPHPDYCSIVSLLFHFPVLISLLYISNWCVCTSILLFFSFPFLN